MLAAALCVTGVAEERPGAAVTADRFNAGDYAALRERLRAFYPDWGQGDLVAFRDIMRGARGSSK